MNTVMLNDIDMYEEYGLILTDVKISPPEPKLITVDIPGADGIIDLTEVLNGEAKYQNRTIEITFKKKGNTDVANTIVRKISNKFHGQIVRVVFSDNIGYYYTGRAQVSDFAPAQYSCSIKMKIDVEPYALEMIDSIEDWIWDSFNFESDIIREYRNLKVESDATITVYGSRKTVVPVINVSEDMTVSKVSVDNTMTYNLKKGDNRIIGIEIREGKNILQFHGNGVVSIKFRGGSL